MNKYVELLSNYHRSKPLFNDHTDLATRPYIALNDAFISLLPALDIDSAVGAQLDILGEWIGRSRKIVAPIEDYFFTFDHLKLGFDQGSWKNRFEADSGIISVDDNNYRIMLKAKIHANVWDGTAETLPVILNTIYGNGETSISFTDNQDMTITFSVSGKTVSTITKEIIRQGYLAIKPAGVTVNYQFAEE